MRTQSPREQSYVALPFDLSRVVFVTTANSADFSGEDRLSDAELLRMVKVKNVKWMRRKLLKKALIIRSWQKFVQMKVFVDRKMLQSL